MLYVFAVVYILLPPAYWAVRARTVLFGVVVGVLLAAWAVLMPALAADWVDLRNKQEVYALYLPVAALVMVLGDWAERVHVGRREERAPLRVRVVRFVYCAQLLFLMPLALLLGVVLAGDPQVPPAWAAPNLPPGFSARPVSEGCGNGHHASCRLTLEVTPPPGLSREEAARRLKAGKQHREAYGWLLDRRDFSTGVEERNGRFLLHLTLVGQS